MTYILCLSRIVHTYFIFIYNLKYYKLYDLCKLIYLKFTMQLYTSLLQGIILYLSISWLTLLRMMPSDSSICSSELHDFISFLQWHSILLYYHNFLPNTFIQSCTYLVHTKHCNKYTYTHSNQYFCVVRYRKSKCNISHLFLRK